jgi:hypothetical protein
MTISRVGLLLSTLTAACTLPSTPLGMEESGDGTATDALTDGGSGDDATSDLPSPGSTTLMGSTGATSTGDATDDAVDGDDATVGSTVGDDTQGCGFIPCPECPDTCDEIDECVDGSLRCDCQCENECDIAEVAADYAAMSKVAAIDCGNLETGDPTEEWAAAQQCVLQAAAVSSAFIVIADTESLDSNPRQALVGVVGFAYEKTRFSKDTGGSQPPYGPVFRRPCQVIEATKDCTPGDDNLCLSCSPFVDSTIACEPG